MVVTGISTNLLLEMFNGCWAILAAYAAAFLIFHLRDIGARRGVVVRHWLGDLPQSMQLAVAILAISVGVFLSRAPVWYWRWSTAGGFGEFGSVKFGLLAGAMIGCAGFLCLIRVVTRPMLSHWPWLAAGATVMIYVTITLALRA